jgi:hypothetical protein
MAIVEGAKADRQRLWHTLSDQTRSNRELGTNVESRGKYSSLTHNNQDHMERFWSNSIFKYLRVEPEDHHFLLTEPASPFTTKFRRSCSNEVGSHSIRRRIERTQLRFSSSLSTVLAFTLLSRPCLRSQPRGPHQRCRTGR